jgi:hypothetical protein
MFVSAIQGDVHLYNKPGKQIIGVTHKYRLLRFRDLLEANIGAITTILIIVTALNTLALFFR